MLAGVDFFNLLCATLLTGFNNPIYMLETNKNYLIHGAIESPKDSRTIKEPKVSLLAYFTFPKDGGREIKPECILDQNRVGICTSISLVELIFDRTSKRFSEDFQYLIQKKYYDKGWFEGSSVFNAIKAGYDVGFLPKEIFDQYFQRDPNENYDSYSSRLKQIADNETLMKELLAKCEKVIQGYTNIGTSLVALAKAIDDTENGVLARYTCGWSWFYKYVNGILHNCWNGESIEPITEPVATPTFPITGHAVPMPVYKMAALYVGNTWSKLWCADGHSKIDYLPTEAYKVYFKNFNDQWKLPIKKSEFKHKFAMQMGLNATYRYETELLQYALIFEECMEWIKPEARGYYGLKTVAGVRKFQKKYGISATGYVGIKTLAKLNELYNK